MEATTSHRSCFPAGLLPLGKGPAVQEQPAEEGQRSGSSGRRCTRPGRLEREGEGLDSSGPRPPPAMGTPPSAPTEPRSGTQPCLHHSRPSTSRLLQRGPGSQLRERWHRAGRATGHAHGLRHERRWRVAAGARCRAAVPSLLGLTRTSRLRSFVSRFLRIRTKAVSNPPTEDLGARGRWETRRARLEEGTRWHRSARPSPRRAPRSSPHCVNPPVSASRPPPA